MTSKEIERQKVSFQVRMHPDMHARLKRSAEINGRSINSEMNAVWERGLMAQSLEDVVTAAIIEGLKSR